MERTCTIAPNCAARSASVAIVSSIIANRLVGAGSKRAVNRKLCGVNLSPVNYALPFNYTKERGAVRKGISARFFDAVANSV